MFRIAKPFETFSDFLLSHTKTSHEPVNDIAMDRSKVKNAVFVFVPGAWHTTDYLEPMRNYLSEKGYDSVAVSHQTLDPINPGRSVFDDASKLEKAIKELLDTGRNVIVVMREFRTPPGESVAERSAHLTLHKDSYGGAVGSQAIGHLLSKIKSTPSTHDEDKAGKMGKVLRLVYVAALIPQADETSAALGELIAAENGNKGLPIDFVDGKMFCKEEIKEVFYGDLPPSERNKYYHLLHGWPVTGRPDVPTHFGWKFVPSTYICAMNDQAVSAKAQTRMWTRVKEVLEGTNTGIIQENLRTASSGDLVNQGVARGTGLLTVKEIDSDHCSMFILRKHVELLGSFLIEMVEI
ncbi:hypothetical protein N0V82_010201 [Gnomoniopsis sp. IMI 355080]|nr:hypothetical protein N0V82_010201 [Gnomoniopsis sp. IMI 355080]